VTVAPVPLIAGVMVPEMLFCERVIELNAAHAQTRYRFVD
jgi:hypothetical protein